MARSDDSLRADAGRARDGFTLIEVLAGVVVIGLVSGVLLIVLSDLIRAAGNTDRTSTAAGLAGRRRGTRAPRGLGGHQGRPA